MNGKRPLFVFSLSKESPHIFSKFNPLTDSPLKWTLSTAPSVSLLMVFDCTSGTDEQVEFVKFQSGMFSEWQAPTICFVPE